MCRARKKQSRCWVALVLLRASLLVVGLHLSGIAHLAADIFEIATTGHHSGTPFDLDEDDPDQTPGSPACHHAQPGGASLASANVVRIEAPFSVVLGVIGPDDRAPAIAIQQSVYRPPRA